MGLLFSLIDSRERFNSMKCNLLRALSFSGYFKVGFNFMKVFAFSRELAGWFYTDFGLFDSFRQNPALVNGLDTRFGASDSFRPNRVNASDMGFDSADIFVLRRIVDATGGGYGMGSGAITAIKLVGRTACRGCRHGVDVSCRIDIG